MLGNLRTAALRSFHTHGVDYPFATGSGKARLGMPEGFWVAVAGSRHSVLLSGKSERHRRCTGQAPGAITAVDWGTSLFEAGWCNYGVGNHDFRRQGSAALLQTLHSQILDSETIS